MMQVTLESLDRRKQEIESRIRNLEERIRKGYPGFKAIPKQKNLTISTDILSVKIGSSLITQEAEVVRENVPCLQDLLKNALERQAVVEQELKAIRNHMETKDEPEEQEFYSPRERVFGATIDMNASQPEERPIYSNPVSSPIDDNRFSVDEDKTESESDSVVRIGDIGQVPPVTARYPQKTATRGRSVDPDGQNVSYFITTSCHKRSNRMNSESKNTERNSMSRFNRFDQDHASPDNYMEKYIKAIKSKQNKQVIKFDSIVICEQTRNRVIERIEARIVASMTIQRENNKNPKLQRDVLLGSFDLQNKLRDGLLQKVLELQGVKKTK